MGEKKGCVLGGREREEREAPGFAGTERTSKGEVECLEKLRKAKEPETSLEELPTP